MSVENKGDITPEVQQVINERHESMDALADEKLPHLTARQECYKRIIGSAKDHMEAYYRRYPERAVDERSKDAEDWTLRALRDSFDIMDEYNIDFRESKREGN